MIFIWLLILACAVQSQEPEPLNHVTCWDDFMDCELKQEKK